MEKGDVVVKNKMVYFRGKKVGVITKDGVFMAFKREKDKFRMFDGWGFSRAVIRFIAKNLPDVWMMYVKTEKRVLKIPFWEIEEKGIEWRNPEDKTDEQLIVPEKFFKSFLLDEPDSTESVRPIFKE